MDNRLSRILERQVSANDKNSTLPEKDIFSNITFDDIFENLGGNVKQGVDDEIKREKEDDHVIDSVMTEATTKLGELSIHNKISKDKDLINKDTSTMTFEDNEIAYEKHRKNVLQKNENDITREDLPYINSRDIIYQNLPSRYKHIINVRESIDFIYKQFGKEVEAMLKDPTVIEVQLNQDGSIWIEKFGVGKFKTDIIMDTAKGIAVIKLIADYNKKVVTKESSIISAVLPTGERFEGIIGDPVGGNPIFAIRKKPLKIFTLDDYVKDGVITAKQKDVIRKLILEKKNILIAGGTSSGKTTFTNGCLDVLKETTDRVLIIEDTPELICNVDNKVELLSTFYTSTRDLLQSAMRLTPDRIVVGEVRRGDVLIELLKLWNSGHDGGMCTIHAGSAESALLKVEQYLGEVTKSPQTAAILEAVHIVISMAKENNRRVVKEIKKVVGYDEINKKYILEEV